MSEYILLVHLASTLVMVGVIWFVQIVHYPLMAQVARSDFTAYEREHQHRTTFIVAPTMLVEAVTAIVLLAIPPAGMGRILPAAGASLLAVIWLSTFLVQVRQHTRLSTGFHAITHRRLVRYNWLRTVSWTARGILVLAMVGAVLVLLNQ
ncbi:MAG: hypothetical protein ACYC6N_32365 [Pirellulaceae bacterium]